MANAGKLLVLKKWARGEWDKKEAGLLSEWRQAFWFTKTACGTACCLAGKQMILEGFEPVFYFSELGSFAMSPEGEVVAVEDAAQEMLGLTDNEADELFYGGNTLKDVEEIIDRLIDGTFDIDAIAEARAARRGSSADIPF